MFNYKNLSDVEFEYLVRDIMQKCFGVPLHRFGIGKDGGIDLVDDLQNNNIVVQVRHYHKTPFSGLYASLKKEVAKVIKLNPKQYYVVCSCTLTPDNTKEIYNLFSSYMKSSKNVLSITDIDDFLQLSENREIVNSHYKLWLESSNVLSNMISKEIFLDSQVLLAKIQQHKQLYVQTQVFEQAYNYLLKKRVLLLIGAPGVGKTITSEMLVLRFSADGYTVRFTTDGEDLASLKKSLSNNPSQKEIILLDDCLGQYYFKMKDTQENKLLSLVRYVQLSKNKILLLNSRVTIYNEARERNLDFFKEIKNGEIKVKVIDMSSISLIEKAKIFYNHLYFNLPKDYFNVIKKDKRYLDIINHQNYSPRIIEIVTFKSLESEIIPTEYYLYVKEALDHPNKIWENEFNHRLQPADRLLLTTLFSLTDTLIEADMLKRCFNRRIEKYNNIDKTIDNFSLSLMRLNGSMVAIYTDKTKVQKIGSINPSINDFLSNLVADGSSEKKELEKAIMSVPQVFRFYDNEIAKSIILEKFSDGSILDFEHESERLKAMYIINYIANHQIMKECYKGIISDYLSSPYDLYHVGNISISKTRMVSLFLKEDVREYYDVINTIFDFLAFDKLISDNSLEELIELICALEPFAKDLNISRKDYLDLIIPHLKDAIEIFVEDVDAADASNGFDIGSIINNNTSHEYFDDGISFPSVDDDAAASELEEYICDSVKTDLVNLLSDLPEDMTNLLPSQDDTYVSVTGADSVISSYFEADRDYDADDYAPRTTDYSEIDHMFNR